MEAVAKMDDRHATIEQTYRTERRRLLEFIRKRVRREQDAEDILQDVFYQLIAGYSVTEPIEKLASWLFTVARNIRSPTGIANAVQGRCPLIEMILLFP